MSEEIDVRPDSDVSLVKALPVVEFEGEFVRTMEGRLPAITMEMPEGYARGTHLILGVEARVRNVRYDEDRRGDLIRQHVFALEEVQLLKAFDPAHRPENVGGSAAGDAWLPTLLAYLRGDTDLLDFDGEEIPERLRLLIEGSLAGAWTLEDAELDDPLPLDESLDEPGVPADLIEVGF